MSRARDGCGVLQLSRVGHVMAEVPQFSESPRLIAMRAGWAPLVKPSAHTTT